MKEILKNVLKNAKYPLSEEYPAEARLSSQLSDKGLDYIADFLLENGIIVPPCKVGDTIYMIERNIFNPRKDKIVSLTVTQIIKDNNNLWIKAYDGRYYSVKPYTDYCYTQEEAKANLRKTESN